MPEQSLAAGFDEATYEQWLTLVEKVLKGADFDKKLVSHTDDGLAVRPLYTRSDALAGGDLSTPGAAPFTRGAHEARSGFGWDIRQHHGDTDPDAVNMAILEDLAGGVNSIELQLQTTGQAGLPTSPQAMLVALAGVDLAICPVALLPGENFGAAAAYLLGNWAIRKIPKDQRMGAFNADPLGTLASTGRATQSLAQSMPSAAVLFAKTQDMPGVTAMLADGRVYHNAGASEAQELAMILATLVAYLRLAKNAGISPAKALPKIAVALCADTDQFLTIAKLRAARTLVWHVAQAAGIGEAAGRVQFHASTSARMMAKRDAHVNMLRTTIACAGAGMGGADAITVAPFTQALGKPDAFARRIARNTQIVLQEESALGRVIDPAGGSWYVEQLTDELARKAWSIFQNIESEGGMAGALVAGFVQDMIGETAATRNGALADGMMSLTGVSVFADLSEDTVDVQPHAAMPDIAPGALKVRRLRVTRLAAPFEALRDAADEFVTRTGTPPRVFMANLGEPVDFAARATWAANFFAVGGIEAVGGDGFTNSADAGAAFEQSGAKIACICSSDEVYGELGESVASLLKTAGAKAVYLAGTPGDLEDALKSAGVDKFLYARCNMLAALQAAHEALGESH